jgi:hypothetical protein
MTKTAPAGRSRAPRLDELLAWLWEYGLEPKFRLIDGLSYVTFFTGGPGEEEHCERAPDRLAALVSTVIYVLNSERSPE